MGSTKTELLIIGAGPFGLALAAQAQHENVEHLIVGKPMEFWRSNMPKGMFLRSACDWHYDTQNVHTIEAYLQSRGQTSRDVEPLSLEFYLTYVDWFQRQKNIDPLPVYVERLDSAKRTPCRYNSRRRRDKCKQRRAGAGIQTLRTRSRRVKGKTSAR